MNNSCRYVPTQNHALFIINYSLFTNNMCRVSAPTPTHSMKKSPERIINYSLLMIHHSLNVCERGVPNGTYMHSYVSNNIIKEMNNHSSCTPSEYKKKSKQMSKISSKCSVIPNNSKISGEPESLLSSGSFLVLECSITMGDGSF